MSVCQAIVGRGAMNFKSQDTKQPLHEAIYLKLREALSKGEYAPGRALSLRNLSAQFEGSVTPVRDAIWRLTAEGAIAISSTRRISVPVLEPEEIRQLLLVRALLEPEAAALALKNINTDLIEKMTLADEKMNQSVARGDISGYMAHNFEFHFTLYRASFSSVLIPLLEGLWVRFGPFMRHAYPNVKSVDGVIDHHAEALEAIKNRNEAALRSAIIADVNDGLEFLLNDFGG